MGRDWGYHSSRIYLQDTACRQTDPATADWTLEARQATEQARVSLQTDRLHSRMDSTCRQTGYTVN